MSNRERHVSLFLTVIAVAVLGACRHKPAYSDIDTTKPVSSQNQNSAAPAVNPPPPEGTTAPTPPPTPPPTPQTKMPSFFDQTKGTIKDLPNYPHAARAHLQVGPIGELNVASIILKSHDDMDKIAAFYDKAIKDNQWKVKDKIIDPELSEWNLEKEKGNEGRVQVKRDVQTGIKNIVIVRSEKLEAAK